jgi:hypothetical protein
MLGSDAIVLMSERTRRVRPAWQTVQQLSGRDMIAVTYYKIKTYTITDVLVTNMPHYRALSTEKSH